MKKILNRKSHFIILLIFISFFSCHEKKTEIPVTKKKDSISIWIQKSKKTSFNIKEKKTFLRKAYNNIKNEKDENLKAKTISEIAYRYYRINDTATFKVLNNKALKIAIKIKDSFVIGDAYWSFAAFYLKQNEYNKSYYYNNQAFLFFDGIKKEYEAARMLDQMSFIKGRYRDYTGSEVLLFQAIKKYKKIKNYKWLYYCYRDLGQLQNDIKEYEKALVYHEKALVYLRKVDNNEQFLSESSISIGNVYNNKKEYKKAITYFNKALKTNTGISNYATTIDNRAYSKLMLKDTLNVKRDLHRALFIRDSLKIKAGITYSKIRLSKYYGYIKDTLKAYTYAIEANILAKEIKNGVDYLASLEQLTELDPKNSKKYLTRYIQFNDSLINVERKVQNKFTRIEFQTDEIKEESERLSQQKIWILTSSFGIILILCLLYFLRVQKAKTERLLSEAEQQKANEEVYLLTLKQQTLLEEEKTQERNRISQELHDGILGKLFGTRVSLGFLDLTGDKDTEEKHESFLNDLQDIEKEIRDVSHKLSTDFNSSEVNFTNIIQQLLKEKSTIGNFKYQLNIDKSVSWKKTDELIKANIYRIIQESLQNIVKHANAKNVILAFSQNKEHLTLVIKDDGLGFDQKKNKKGIGLKNIKSRVEKINGTLEIKSEKNKGTIVTIQLLSI